MRDWATFGVGTQGDYDDERIRQALLARVDHPHRDVRFEAITGLCRRQDERVRPALERELADPYHSDDYDRALEFLDTGADVPEDGWETPAG